MAEGEAKPDPWTVTPEHAGGGQRYRAGKVTWKSYLGAVALVGLAAAVAAALGEVVAQPDIVMLYLLVIMIVAARFGRGPSIAAAALSVASYDFLFVHPLYTFSVSETRHLLTFAMMFGVGGVISALTLRIRRQELDARMREQRTAALYDLSRELGQAMDEKAIAKILATHAARVLECEAVVLLKGPLANAPAWVGYRTTDAPLENDELGVVRWVLEHGEGAGVGTDVHKSSPICCLPLGREGAVLGALVLAPQRDLGFLIERDFTEAFVRQATLSLERTRLAEDARSAALRARTEEMRSSLLSAVSHDLRTPLAVITGAATTMRDPSVGISEGERQDLVITICEEAEQLERLVANLLDMTRLESGALTLKREWLPFEEVIGSALTRLEVRLAGRPVSIDIAAGIPPVSVDPVLFQQLFVNLLENACKYTPPNSPIEIRATSDPTGIKIEVNDRGPGLPRGDEGKLFQKFYRGHHVGSAGVGLGLAICRAIVETHGGAISAETRSDGGASFRVSLPFGPAACLPQESAA